MGLLVDRAWPEELTGVLKDVLERIPTETLADAVAHIPAFETGGFRPSATKPQTLRRRVLQVLRGTGEVPEYLRRLVVKQSLQGKVVGLLSEELLLGRRNELEACFGTEALLLGTLLDVREKVRQAASERLAALAHRRVERDCTRTKLAVESLFGGLFEELTPVIEAAARDEGASADDLPLAQVERIAGLERDLREARTKAARADALEGKVSRLEESLETQRREAERWRSAADEQARQLAAVEAESARLRGALDEFRRTRDHDVEQVVSVRLAQEERAWLREAQAADEVVRDPAPAELAERARQLLERQRTVDRRAGTRSALRRRAEELSVLRDELLRAQADALTPLSELAGVAKELDGELARLARIPEVSDGASPNSAVLQLLACMATADEAGIAELDGAAVALEKLGLLTAHDRSLLRAARRDRLARKLVSAGAGEGKDRSADPAAALRRAWRALSGDASGATFLVDGHNLLLNPDLPYAHDGRAGEGERRRLAQDIASIIAGLPEGDARVYFDGPTAGEEGFGPKVLVVFSGGIGENRADDRIVDDLRFRKRGAGRLRSVLVTDDRELRARARHVDAKLVVLGSPEFAVLRGHAGTLRAPGHPPILKKSAGGLR